MGSAKALIFMFLFGVIWNMASYRDSRGRKSLQDNRRQARISSSGGIAISGRIGEEPSTMRGIKAATK
jgi:hypothetical protein